MNKLPRHTPVDYAKYAPDAILPGTMYGLPQHVAFCRTCLISNQRPNSTVEYKHTSESRKATIHFDENGICDACRVAADKKRIDWTERERELKDLCDRFRKNDGSYDCIVPGSGGKDSFYAAHLLKFKYNMHPLTVTWAPHIYTDWGLKNHQSWIHAGFDNELHTPNGRVHRLLTRLAVEKLFHPFQPFIIGQKALAPKLSALHGIPLVIYGENEAEYGNPQVDSSVATRDWKYFVMNDTKDVYISGCNVAELMQDFGLDRNDLQPYLPASPDALHRSSTEVHYLGYYLPWHPQSCYYYAVEHGNFTASPERTPGTYSKYNSIDDKIDDLHYYTTYVKFGIGRATYDAAQEIRSGDISKDEGLALIRRYDGEFPSRFFDELCQYLSIVAPHFPKASAMFEQPKMDLDYFMHLADRFRPPHLWQWQDDKWSLRHTAWNQQENA